jgi:hypothetical protein
MNDTGPDAVPPPASSSFDDGSATGSCPVPEPNLKSMPSVRASVRIESIVSWTELMKQAEHCGAFSKPQLNHTGAVERRLLLDEDVLQVVAERLQIFLGSRSTCSIAPLGDGVDDAADAAA